MHMLVSCDMHSVGYDSKRHSCRCFSHRTGYLNKSMLASPRSFNTWLALSMPETASATGKVHAGDALRDMSWGGGHTFSHRRSFEGAPNIAAGQLRQPPQRREHSVMALRVSMGMLMHAMPLLRPHFVIAKEKLYQLPLMVHSCLWNFGLAPMVP